MVVESEITVFALDVRKQAEKLTENGIKCTREIIKEKICMGKKNYVSFVLFGTDRTENCANTNVDEEGYMNIVQYKHIIPAAWEILVEFLLLTTEPKHHKGEWMDAIVVAMEMIKSISETQIFERCKIVLFHDFDSASPEEDLFDVITKNLKQMGIELIVVSTNIVYIDDEDGLTKTVFREYAEKSLEQQQNEQFALRLPAACNALLCSFYDASNSIQSNSMRRPWVWNCVLKIGTKISLNLSGVIPVKDEVLIKLKKRVAGSEERAETVKKYYSGANEIFPEDADLIDGYMLGATPIAYDPSLGQKSEPTVKGLHFIGFVRKQSILEEFISDGSLYWLVHRKNTKASAKLMDALVRALLHEESGILAWKVYNNGLTPKYVLLLPNEIDDENYPTRPPSLTMVEIAYQQQYNYVNALNLRAKKTNPSQVECIDKYIDSLNSTLSENYLKEKPRETVSKDLLPYKFLPNIVEQKILDLIENHLYENCCENDVKSVLPRIDDEKIFWKVPALLEAQAIEALEAVKEQFSFQETEKSSKQKSSLHFDQKIQDEAHLEKLTQPQEMTKVNRVGTLTPAEDFQALIDFVVLKIQNVTMRNARFQEIAYEMRSVIWDLLFKSLTDQQAKVAEAIKVYRLHAITFNPYDYNDWIAEIKQKVVERQMFDFWENVIVREKLGLCFGQHICDDKEAEEAFYAIDRSTKNSQNIADNDGDTADDVSYDDLLANM